MTNEEMRLEWAAAFQTALGRMCDNREPTDEQKQLARNEATEHVRRCQAAETQQNSK